MPGSLGIVVEVRDSRFALLYIWSSFYDVLPSRWSIPITQGSNSGKD
jgi:hypothetical protein